MSRKWFSIIALIAVATFFLSLSSCGFNRHLVSIQIAPTSVTFGGGGRSPQSPPVRRLRGNRHVRTSTVGPRHYESGDLGNGLTPGSPDQQRGSGHNKHQLRNS